MAGDNGSPFLAIDPAHWVASHELAFAVRDRYPVSPGHALVIPRRPVPDWWSTTPAEREALLALVEQVVDELRETHRPDGFNIGLNNNGGRTRPSPANSRRKGGAGSPIGERRALPGSQRTYPKLI